MIQSPENKWCMNRSLKISQVASAQLGWGGGGGGTCWTCNPGPVVQYSLWVIFCYCFVCCSVVKTLKSTMALLPFLFNYTKTRICMRVRKTHGTRRNQLSSGQCVILRGLIPCVPLTFATDNYKTTCNNLNRIFNKRHLHQRTAFPIGLITSFMSFLSSDWCALSNLIRTFHTDIRLDS